MADIDTPVCTVGAHALICSPPWQTGSQLNQRFSDKQAQTVLLSDTSNAVRSIQCDRFCPASAFLCAWTVVDLPTRLQHGAVSMSTSQVRDENP